MADEATQVADKTDSGEMDGLRSSLVENVDSLESKQTANQKGKKRKICKEEKQLNKVEISHALSLICKSLFTLSLTYFHFLSL